MKKIFLLSILLCVGKIYGQAPAAKNSNANRVAIHNVNNTVEIEFQQKEKSNLLVLLADTTGHTVFLDNRYNFTGAYKQKIKIEKKGKYFLKVIDDADKFSKTFTIK